MAPVTLSNVLSSGSLTSGTAFTTASATPTAGRVYLLGFSGFNSTGSVNPPVGTATISGTNGWNGATWQLVDATNGKLDHDTAGTDRGSMALFYSNDVPGGSAGTLTITFSSSVTRLTWTLEVTDANVDTASAIVQVPAPVAVNSTTVTVTLAAFADSTNNAGYACCAHQTNEATSAEAGWTSLSSVAQSANAIGSEYKSGGSDLSATMTWTTSARGGLIAVEIKAVAATVGSVYRRDPHRGLTMR